MAAQHDPLGGQHLAMICVHSRPVSLRVAVFVATSTFSALKPAPQASNAAFADASTANISHRQPIPPIVCCLRCHLSLSAAASLRGDSSESRKHGLQATLSHRALVAF
eukprot:3569172-Pyramimonas_sp.AAC.1